MLTEYGKSNVVDKLLVQGVMRNYGHNEGDKSPGKDSTLRERPLGADNNNNVSFSDNKHNRSPHHKKSRVSPIKNEPSPRR